MSSGSYCFKDTATAPATVQGDVPPPPPPASRRSRLTQWPRLLLLDAMPAVTAQARVHLGSDDIGTRGRSMNHPQLRDALAFRLPQIVRRRTRFAPARDGQPDLACNAAALRGLFRRCPTRGRWRCRVSGHGRRSRARHSACRRLGAAKGGGPATCSRLCMGQPLSCMQDRYAGDSPRGSLLLPHAACTISMCCGVPPRFNQISLQPEMKTQASRQARHKISDHRFIREIGRVDERRERRPNRLHAPSRQVRHPRPPHGGQDEAQTQTRGQSVGLYRLARSL